MKGVFQYIIFAIFGIFIFVGILFFTGVLGRGNTTSPATQITGQVTIWGTLPQTVIDKVLTPIAQEKNITITYLERSVESINESFTEAVASGKGPDLLIAPHEVLIKQKTKLKAIPYENFSARTFRDSFVQIGELFFQDDGMLGIPLFVDPVILYWNRTLFENRGLLQAPTTWKELSDITPQLTEQDTKGTISTSAISLGTINNVSLFKEILSLMFMQVGNPIVSIKAPGTQGGTRSVLNQESTFDGTMKAIEYFISFADPTTTIYTWNRVQPKDQDAFVGEESAMYMGFAHEIPEIRDRNPNLNFDVAQIPQVDGSKTKSTYARMIGISLVRSTKNPNGAFYVATKIAEPDIVAKITKELFNTNPVAPARRELLVKPPETLYGPTLFNSAIVARGWYDVDASETKKIFATMVQDIIRGSQSTAQAVNEASGRIGNLLK